MGRPRVSPEHKRAVKAKQNRKMREDYVSIFGAGDWETNCKTHRDTGEVHFCDLHLRTTVKDVESFLRFK